MVTIDNVPSDSYEPWRASLTEREAARQEISRDEYGKLYDWARMVVEHHQRLRTPRDRWEGTPNHNAQLVGPYVEDGEQELAERLEEEADPVIDDAQAAAETARADLAAATDPRLVETPESGSTYNIAAAVEVVHTASAKIEADFRAGKPHHRRVPPWVVAVSQRLPWLEAAGLLGFIAYFMDVPLFEPWEDWFGFSLGVTIVSVAIYGQTRLVHEAGSNHNAGREAAADGNRQEADDAYGRRNRFLGLVSIVAVGITAGLILRGVAVLGDASAAIVILLVFLATLAGVLMPLITYLATAFDGSKVSRERDSLAGDLDDDLDDHLQRRERCGAELASIAEAKDTLEHKIFPDICNGVQERVDAAYGPYNTARILIGHLAADPPKRMARSVDLQTDGHSFGEIGTGIPGCRSVDLRPLLDRAVRIKELDRQRQAIQERLDALPQHPWAGSHGA